MRLGVNLEAISSEGRTWFFADLMRQRSPWGTFDTPYDGKAAVDVNGNPTGDAGCYLIQGSDLDPIFVPAGTYIASWYGGGDIVPFACSFSVSNKIVAEDGRTTAFLNVPTGNLNLAVRFKGTKGVQFAKLIIPNHGDGDIYNNDLITLLKKFGLVRFMDATRTNNNPSVHWSDRAGRDGWQAGDRGIAWEHVVGICNAAGCDAWINVPHMADDDYREKLALLFKQLLRPDLRIYLEYSNEVWNSQFTQYGYNMTQAAQEQNSGQAAYEYKGSNNPNNPVYWGFRRVAAELSFIGATFSAIFGKEQMGTRIRPILGHQIMWYDQLPDMLAYMKTNMPNGLPLIWGVGCGSYLGPVRSEISKTSTSTDLIKALRDNLPGIDKENSRVKTTCDQYGLKNCAYEFGTDTTQLPMSAQAIVTAQDDSAMMTLVADLLSVEGTNLHTGCYYLLSGVYSGNGTWPLTNHYLGPSVKLSAATSYALSNDQGEPRYTPKASPSTTSAKTIVNITTTVRYSDGTSDTFAH